MEEIKDIVGMLDLMIQPAFSVTDGIIRHVNAAAKSQLGAHSAAQPDEAPKLDHHRWCG